MLSPIDIVFLTIIGFDSADFDPADLADSSDFTDSSDLADSSNFDSDSSDLADSSGGSDLDSIDSDLESNFDFAVENFDSHL